jgi:26S proteasome regulatory subunit N2
LIDEKLKKVTTEKAPVAGAGSGSGSAGASGLTPRQQQSLLTQALRGPGAGSSNIRDINELFQLGARGAGDSRASALSGLGGLLGAGGAPGTGSGAAAAAGVLTAVDEDGEGDEEAPVPGDFEYFTDAEDE